MRTFFQLRLKWKNKKIKTKIKIDENVRMKNAFMHHPFGVYVFPCKHNTQKGVEDYKFIFLDFSSPCNQTLSSCDGDG